jgi:adenylosuccinate synthase
MQRAARHMLCIADCYSSKVCRGTHTLLIAGAASGWTQNQCCGALCAAGVTTARARRSGRSDQHA